MKWLVSTLLTLVLAFGISVSFGADSGSTTKDKKERTQVGDKDKDKPDPNKGGAGVGPPTVHGCDSQGCGNNGPHEPTPPKKKCHKDKSGIEICD